jgi:hypothetical protein
MALFLKILSKNNNEMKGKILKPFILSALLLLFVIPVHSQAIKGTRYASDEDSINCGRYLSAYTGFFRLKLYEDVYDSWWYVVNNCPAASEKMYVDGVTMYRYFIDASPYGPGRENLIDTLMLIYDLRMEYFGGEGNVLGRKGRDLLTYRGEDIEAVQQAYEILKQSIDLQGLESRETAMLYYISAGIRLNKEEKIDDNQIIDDYLRVIGIMDQQEKRGSRWERARASIDDLMLREGILSCEALNTYYKTLFESEKNERTFLKKLITVYTISGCDRSDFFVLASENLYKIEPGPESAYNLAILFITRNDFEMAAVYLKEAAEGENLDMETRAERYYELAVVSNANQEYCKAIEYARETIKLQSDYGKAYILLGDAFIASRNSLGDDFQQRTAFWAATDKYMKASSVDPSLSEESKQKLDDYTGQFPNNEEVFFRDMKDGDSYLVQGCINENTTVRSRK